jgi:hypothetical protein
LDSKDQKDVKVREDRKVYRAVKEWGSQVHQVQLALDHKDQLVHPVIEDHPVPLVLDYKV